MIQMITTDEGKVLAFAPDDYRYVVHQRDVDEGKYEPRIESTRIDGDRVQCVISQTIPPLVKIR